MIALFKKYKWYLLYLAIILYLMLYFVPKQRLYYLDEDIKHLKSHYVIPVFAGLFGALAVGLLIYWLIKRISLKKSLPSFLSVCLYLAFVLFIFHDVFLGMALFVNRQITTGKLDKSYKASTMAGMEPSRRSFLCTDLTTRETCHDRKVLNELYRPGLRNNEIHVLPLKIGLLGVPFASHPLDDKWGD